MPADLPKESCNPVAAAHRGDEGGGLKLVAIAYKIKSPTEICGISSQIRAAFGANPVGTPPLKAPLPLTKTRLRGHKIFGCFNLRVNPQESRRCRRFFANSTLREIGNLQKWLHLGENAVPASAAQYAPTVRLSFGKLSRTSLRQPLTAPPNRVKNAPRSSRPSAGTGDCVPSDLRQLTEVSKNVTVGNGRVDR